MRAPGRHRPSSIDKLDPEIKAMIGSLRIDHGWSIDEIRVKLVALGQSVSRSALARHTKSLEEVGAQLRQSREMARALIEQAGSAPDDKVADLNIELMHVQMLRLLTATNDEGDGEPIMLDPASAMQISKALQSLAGARKTNTDMMLKARDEARKEAAKKAGDAAKSKGLSTETVDFIRHAVLGSGE